jgi:tol-pal system protein YbgF
MTSVRYLTVAAACAWLAGCATTPPEEDPVVQKLTELDSRLLRIERVLANNSLLDLSQRIEAAQAETRTLRGQLDELQHQVQQTQNQQRDMYADADRRLSALEGGGPRASVNSGTGTDLPVPQGDDRANYQAAFDLLKDGKYNEAIAGFRQFLTTFPTSALADNAQYWLGEAHYVNKQYTDALRDFRTVLEKYPDSRKIPDALLKIGFCNYELKDFAGARSSLNQVVQRFGDTTAARLASQRIAKMDGEGR